MTTLAAAGHGLAPGGRLPILGSWAELHDESCRGDRSYRLLVNHRTQQAIDLTAAEAGICQQLRGECDGNGDAVVIPVDRAGVCRDEDHVRHQVVVDHLDGAVCGPVLPGPGVVESGGEELRVVVVRRFANDVQLHKGAPGSAGTSNVSSVTTREAVTWAAASGGSVAASNEPEWTNWAGTDPEIVTDLSFWSASTSGTFGFSMPLDSSVTMHVGDSLTLTDIDISIPTAS